MNDDDDMAIDELFAAARDLRAPPGAEARGWARFEAALGGAGPASAGEAVLAKTSPLVAAAKLGGVLAVVLAIVVPMSGRDGPAPEHRPATTAAPTTSPLVEPEPGQPVATPVSLPPQVASPPPSTLPRAPARPKQSAAARTVAVPEPAAEPAAEPGPVVVQRPTALSGGVAPAAPLVPGPALPSPTTTDSLRLEAKLLGRAWVAIREGQADRTRALLAEHERRFPHGALAPERVACATVERCIGGDREAIEQARTYLRQHRASHLAARVAAGCGLELSGEPVRSRDETTPPAADGSR